MAKPPQLLPRQEAAGAARAKHHPRKERPRQTGSSKTRAADKWTWAGSSFELNPRLPARQQNTGVIRANCLSNPPRSTRALFPAPLGAIHCGSAAADLGGRFLAAITRLTRGRERGVVESHLWVLLPHPLAVASPQAELQCRHRAEDGDIHDLPAQGRKEKEQTQELQDPPAGEMFAAQSTRPPADPRVPAQTPAPLGSNQLLVAPGAK